jgi:hypothetical protein
MAVEDPANPPADPAASPATPPAGTIVDPGNPPAADPVAPPADPAAPPPVADAPDWRVQMAGDDKEAIKRLSRFAAPADVFKSFRSLEQKISSGEFKKPLGENATPEEKATWRKENGLPEKADDYVAGLALPSGLVIGEAEKPVVSALASVAHEGNIDPKAFNGLVSKYYELQDQQRQAREDADAKFKVDAEDALRKDWQGPDYRRNLTAVNNMLASWPEGVSQAVLGGRDANGRLLGDNPAFIRQMAALALELNPAATLVPAGTTDAGKSVDARLEEIRTMRRTDPDKYNQDAKKLEAEEIELIDAQLKMQKRGRAA